MEINGANAIENSGTIATTGEASHGIYLTSFGSTVTMSGAITTEGEGSFGIYSGDGFSRINLSAGGSIATSGATAYGIYLGDYAQLTIGVPTLRRAPPPAA